MISVRTCGNRLLLLLLLLGHNGWLLAAMLTNCFCHYVGFGVYCCYYVDDANDYCCFGCIRYFLNQKPYHTPNANVL